MQATIRNRHGLNIVLDYTDIPGARGLAILQHGWGGFRDQPHMQAIATVFQDNAINTVNFDATHSIGDSGGDMLHSSLTNHYNDLVDVIAWTRTQPWFQSPLFLAGHSMGGASILNYARLHPHDVRAIAPLSAVMSGASWRTTVPEATLHDWETQGYFNKPSASKPGVVSKVGWDLMVDAMQYDLSVGLAELTMPALFMVGSADDTTPPANQKILYANWGGPKQYHEIPDLGHTPRSLAELDALKRILHGWLHTIV